MKESKFLVVGLIGLLMMVGLVLMGCFNVGCPNDNGCEYRPNASPPIANICNRMECGVYEASLEGIYSKYCNCTS